jgi:hypothetical protein
MMVQDFGAFWGCESCLGFWEIRGFFINKGYDDGRGSEGFWGSY